MEYRQALLRRFRGPGALWRRLSKVNRIVQRSKDNVDQYYQFQKSKIIKAEQLMKDKYGTLYQIPEPMNIHRFLKD